MFVCIVFGWFYDILLHILVLKGPKYDAWVIWVNIEMVQQYN